MTEEQFYAYKEMHKRRLYFKPNKMQYNDLLDLKNKMLRLIKEGWSCPIIRKKCGFSPNVSGYGLFELVMSFPEAKEAYDNWAAESMLKHKYGLIPRQ